MEVISIALSCIGFLVGYILATRSTEKQIIKYIKGITCSISPQATEEQAQILKLGHKVLKKYVIESIQHKEHRKI